MAVPQEQEGDQGKYCNCFSDDSVIHLDTQVISASDVKFCMSLKQE